MLSALDELWPVNRRAWAISRQVLTRFNADLGCAAMTLEAAAVDLDPTDRLDLLERLSEIYNEVCPPPAKPDA